LAEFGRLNGLFGPWPVMQSETPKDVRVSIGIVAIQSISIV